MNEPLEKRVSRFVLKEQLLELLRQGAVIEHVSWGLKPQIYIRLGRAFECVHANSFYSIRKKLVLVKRKWATTYYKLKECEAQKE